MMRILPSQLVTLIDDAFPWAKDQKPEEKKPIYADHIGLLSAIAAMAEAMPDEFITLPPQDRSKYIAAFWSIRAQLDHWQAHGPSGTLDKVKGLDSRNPVAVLRECLAKCTDEPAVGAGKGFEFINDTDLRASLLNDLAAVSRALGNGEWKAATVLGGSLLEALLLWAVEFIKDNVHEEVFDKALDQAIGGPFEKKPPPSDLQRWSLHQLIEVAAQLALISADTAIQARLAKDFRNLIHPGKAIRAKAQCNVGTAMAARAALEFACNDLSKALG